MLQLILHLIGDYITQSDWMATEKTKRSLPAAIHAAVYAFPFLAIGSPLAVLLICLSHFFVDRYRLARYVVYAKNFWFAPQPKSAGWPELTDTGYPADRPVWLAVWLLIIADNTIHLACNYMALRFA